MRGRKWLNPLIYFAMVCLSTFFKIGEPGPHETERHKREERGKQLLLGGHFFSPSHSFCLCSFEVDWSQLRDLFICNRLSSKKGDDIHKGVEIDIPVQ